MTSRASWPALWAVVALVAGADALLVGRAHLELAGLLRVLAPAATLGVLALVFRHAFAGRHVWAVEACGAAALIACASLAAAVLVYCAASGGRPLVDQALERADQALGFDWQAYRRFVEGRPWLAAALSAAYLSMAPQVTASAIYFAWRRDERLAVMLELLLAGLAVSIALFALFPAHPAGGGDGLWRDLIDRLRSRAGMTVELAHIQGLISFPSYHAFVAATLIAVHWRRPWFGAVLPANLLLIASTPVFGLHYLVDVLAGLALAGACVLALRRS